ncbi:SDR family NAD(P)-dependent oxidoreductase [Alkalicaulis satelles]|uniref:SDR family NAD(P)-dependent oxidoreductase n=1 Tax=Alkalicaulis satelles TaxID=2609175 RepID=A0A5M6ZH43_9PROT|nr:SDR family NAD(P)-dependent oxidoreductase [Alkalicaulis satelles]KAA5803465.1 SDR family NAD(P)-dependent oxidoreductase [Alkalicaulis satelles]
MSGAKSVVITGASTGIGYAAAQHLSERGWRVFAGVRKDADARRVAGALGEAVTPVRIDVTDMASVHKAAEVVTKALDGAALSGLVNNAGVAVAGPLLHLPIEEMTRQLDINVTGQLRVTQAFAPMLGARRDHQGPAGRIVNISSVAGFSAAPLVTPYSCSKFALEAFTQGLRRELMLYGIDVVAINPGPIATPIWDKAEELDPEQYKDTDFAPAVARILSYMLKRGRDGLAPVVVAEAIHRALTDKEPKLNTVITPEPFTQWLLGVLPRRMSDKMIAGRLGLTPQALKD